MGGLQGYIQGKLPKRKFDDWIEEVLYELYLIKEAELIKKLKAKKERKS